MFTGDLRMSSFDEATIKEIVAELYQCLIWSPEKAPDWERFLSHFLPDALLVPSARPATPVAAAAFTQRMTKQRDDGNLVHFHETNLGTVVEVFGNIATAFSPYATIVNQGSESRGVNAFFLVKTAGAWKIASMGWDNESISQPIPAHLLSTVDLVLAVE
jgi:hypothetical protein